MQVATELILEANTDPKFQGWAIIELLDGGKWAGYLSEFTIANKIFVSLKMVDSDTDKWMTRFYPPDFITCITTTTEEIARNWSKPFEWWEMPEGRPMEKLPTCEFEIV